MALYHLHVKMISRGKGQSGASALAYRAGVELVDQRIGQSFDYQSKSVQHVEMLLPEHVPEFMKLWQEELAQNRQETLQKFSDYIESFEKRVDSQIYREIEVALPHELTNEQNIKLARDFVQHHCVNKGMVAICNFHFDVDKKTGQSKPHCHVLLSTRHITVDGFGFKNRDWEKKDLVYEWRERWADYVNVTLKEQGIEARVDHRSYADRGIDIEPQLKKSHKVLQRVKQGLESFRYAAFEDIRRRNLFKIQSRPDLVLELVSQNYSTFTDKDILRVIGRYVDSHAVFEEIRTKVFASDELIKLSDTDKQVYTTKSLIRLEAELIECGQRIATRKTHGVLTQHLEAAKAQAVQELKEFGGLNSEQKAAIDHLVTPGRLKTLVGYAGSGKTTALKVAASAWQDTGYKVLGLAPTGRASENLEELGIRAMTLDRYFKSFETGREQYGKGSVFILDEAGMVDSRKMSMLLDIVERQGIKLVLVGDKGQLQAVQAGPPFRMLLDRVAPAKLENIIRQRQDWQKEATQLFGQEKTKQALQHYCDKGHVSMVKETIPELNKLKHGQKLTDEELKRAASMTKRLAGNIYYQIRSDLLHKGVSENQLFPHMRKLEHFPLYQQWKQQREKAKALLEARGLELNGENIDLRHQTKQQMVYDWLKEQQNQPQNDRSSLMLAHSNKDVDDINRMVRDKLKQSGAVAQQEITISVAKDVEVGIHGIQKTRQTKREYQDLKFAVGDQIIFKKNDYGMKVKNGTLGIITEIDTHKVKVMLNGADKREVSFSPTLYPYFRHGWAVTINAAQGTTVDDVKMLASFEQARNLSYVGFTRHRDNFKVYASALEFDNQSLLVDRLSRSHEKLSGVDYQLEPDQFENVLKLDDSLITRAQQRFDRAKDTVHASVHFAKNLFKEPEDLSKSLGPATDNEAERAIKVLGIEEKNRKNTSSPGHARPQRQQQSSTRTRPARKSHVELIAADLEKKMAMIKRHGESYLSKSELEAYNRHMEKIAKDKHFYNQIKRVNPEVVKDFDKSRGLNIDRGFSR
ncbi:MAG: AAA family ATPase [Pseudomonadota bacterium]